jgi:hypothetical protein
MCSSVSGSAPSTRAPQAYGVVSELREGIGKIFEQEGRASSLSSYLLSSVTSEKEHALHLDGIVASLPFTVQQTVAKAVRKEREARLQYTAVLEFAYTGLVGEQNGLPDCKVSTTQRETSTIDSELLENIISMKGKRLVLQQPRDHDANGGTLSSAPVQHKYPSPQTTVEDFQPPRRAPLRQSPDPVLHQSVVSNSQRRPVARPSVPGLALGQNLKQSAEPMQSALQGQRKPGVHREDHLTQAKTSTKSQQENLSHPRHIRAVNAEPSVSGGVGKGDLSNVRTTTV